MNPLRRLGVIDCGVLALILVLAACRSSAAQGVVSLQSPEADAAEARILRLLEERRSTVEFKDRPLAEVIQYFSDAMDISMRLDERALEDASIGPDAPVTGDFRSITLRSALRSMLGRLDLTYIIKNEMLIVTTPEKAGNELITRVYLVRDLVVPVSGDRSYDALSGRWVDLDYHAATVAPDHLGRSQASLGNIHESFARRGSNHDQSNPRNARADCRATRNRTSRTRHAGRGEQSSAQTAKRATRNATRACRIQRTAALRP